MSGRDDDSIQEVRDRVDIVDLIHRYVPLQRAGSSFKGLCPFHTEKTPSFHVIPARQMYYCFGCGAGGDVFSFLMNFEGKGFGEVLRELAEQVGVQLPQRGEGQQRPSAQKKQKEELYHLNDLAARFYQEQLAAAGGRGAREYLEQRGLSSEMCRQFGLGYAPDNWGGLRQSLQSKGRPLAQAEQAGLLCSREKSEGYYDRFRHRIIFPIFLPSRRIAGFGGRALRADERAKYINSPESPIFVKSETLYGLHAAQTEMRRSRYVFLVEGYFDVIAMHQYGFCNTVAALGTSLTAGHAQLLRRYVERVILIFDADQAGQKATERAMELLLPTSTETQVLRLPPGEDPDSFLLRYGHDGLADYLHEYQQPVFDFFVEGLLAEANDQPERLNLAAERIMQLLHKLTNPLLQDLYLRRTAQRLGLEEQRLRDRFRHLARAPRPARSAPKDSEPVTTPSSAQNVPSPLPATSPLEQRVVTRSRRAVEILLKLFLDNPLLMEEVDTSQLLEKIVDPLSRQLLSQVLRDYEEGAESTTLVEGILEQLQDKHLLRQRMARMLLKDPPFDEETEKQTLAEVCQALHELAREQEFHHLDQELRQAEAQGEEERAKELLQRKLAQRQRSPRWAAFFAR